MESKVIHFIIRIDKSVVKVVVNIPNKNHTFCFRLLKI